MKGLSAVSLTGLTPALALMLMLAQSLIQQRSVQERLRGALCRLEQPAALGKLLDRLAHKIRNPLPVIRFLALRTLM